MFKVGDRVRVKYGLKEGKRPCGLHVVDRMLKAQGTTATVKDTHTRPDGIESYLLSTNGYWYREEMLEPAVVHANHISRKERVE